jgi:hypothetical protein
MGARENPYYTVFWFTATVDIPPRISMSCLLQNVCILNLYIKYIYIYIYIKVKFSLEQATKAQRGSRGIALPFL